MKNDLDPELVRRATVHAALSDPARLAIVDSLCLGDASPSELQTQLSIPSNLLAHHLGVLERAGIVHRSRSEGDRRRTYLHLMPGQLESLVHPTVRTAGRVVFVCTQNSARSQLAVALWGRHSRVPAASAGTRPAPRVHPGAVSAATRHDVPLHPITPRQLADVLQPGDFVVAVCDNAHEELGADPSRVHWSIPDPARTGDDDSFDRALQDLASRIIRLAPAVYPTNDGDPQ